MHISFRIAMQRAPFFSSKKPIMSSPHLVFHTKFTALIDARIIYNSPNLDLIPSNDSSVSTVDIIAEPCIISRYECQLRHKWQMVFHQEKAEKVREAGLPAKERNDHCSVPISKMSRADLSLFDWVTLYSSSRYQLS
jgi:hypothetical protein